MRDALEVLRRIAEDDADARSRAYARKVLDSIATFASTNGPAASAPRNVSDLATEVRSKVLARSGFPARLELLADLPEHDARALLTDLIGTMLTADVNTSMLARATERMSLVVTALSGSGARTVTAGPPPVPLPRLATGSSEWRGGLLAMMAPDEILRLARPQLTAGAVSVRRTALVRLAAVASRLGNPPLPLPGPDAPDEVFARLADLLAPIVEPEQVSTTRGRKKPRTPPDEDTGGPEAEVWTGEGAPTRTAYALLDAPDRTPPGRPFELRVGLAEHSASGTLQNAPFAVPVDAFTLQLTVIAPGFKLLGGESWRREMAVTPDDPYPYQVLRLLPLDGFDPDRSVTVEYAVDGRVLGYATRVVRVIEDAHGGGQAPEPEPGGVWVLPDADADRPDLEITIARGNDIARSELAWLVRSRHASVVVDAGPFTSVLSRSDEWAKETIRGIEDRKAADDLDLYLAGAGRTIAAAVPEQVWDALRAVREVTGAAPTVLVASWEPYVPWELAYVEDPWDPAAPPVLGAQAVIGRWTYGAGSRTAGPSPSIEIGTMGVVSGDYQGNLALPQAELEAAAIRESYGATPVDARIRPIIDCLRGTPPADALHFAMHGSSGTAGTNEGLMMADRKYLGSTSVKGVGATSVRAVFLNACQLGQGRILLGEYAGMAEALLGLGVGAVVAPLWKVDDLVAREVAEAFYAAVLQRGVGPAEQMRQERIATGGREGSPAGTRLAYVYFGHPCLRVTWRGHGGTHA